MRWAVLFTLCAGAMSCGPDNYGTCSDYVQSYNAAVAQCNQADPANEYAPLDEASACPAHLNSGGIDCTLYYECLADAYTCVGGVLQGTPDQCTGCI